MNRARLFGITEEGGHWYKKSDGGVFRMSKEQMKHSEDVHIRPEHGWSGYDPAWSANWYRIGVVLQQRTWFRSLTEEQRIQLIKEATNG